MKNSGIYRWLLRVAVCFLLAGCQQLEDGVWNSDAVGVLSVHARSAEDAAIPYPLYLYAFSEFGDCVSTQMIESEDDAIQLELPPGIYRMVAVAGYSDGYVMPEVTHWSDKIGLNSESLPDGPLMIGMSEVEIDSKFKGKLEIFLTYSVTAVEVTLNDIPSDVTEVAVTMSSFYSSMNLEGGFGDPDYVLKLNGSLDESGGWHADPCYVFPGCDEETMLSIAFKLKDGTKVTYGYVWKDTPKVGQPYHLKGSYAGDLMLDGSFVMPEWGDVVDVDFHFGSVEQPDDGEAPGLDLSELPEVGSFWNGCLVVDVGEVDTSGAEILLMSLDEWDVYVVEVEELLVGYSVNGIGGWRLPGYEEAQLLKRYYSDENREALNERIWAYDETLVGLDGEMRYLCLKSGAYYSFAFAGGTNIAKAGEKKSYYVRLVKSYKANL